MKDDDPTFILEGVEIKAVTDKAYLIRYDDWQHWIPKSQCIDEGYERGQVVDFEMTTWIAEQKGIDHE